jgi:hypothetical protein
MVGIIEKILVYDVMCDGCHGDGEIARGRFAGRGEDWTCQGGQDHWDRNQWF